VTDAVEKALNTFAANFPPKDETSDAIKPVAEVTGEFIALGRFPPHNCRLAAPWLGKFVFSDAKSFFDSIGPSRQISHVPMRSVFRGEPTRFARRKYCGL
jgi:hypothetical protein